MLSGLLTGKDRGGLKNHRLGGIILVPSKSRCGLAYRKWPHGLSIVFAVLMRLACQPSQPGTFWHLSILTGGQ